MTSCMFCRVVAGAAPATRLYEDERVLACADIRPQAPVHIILIPKHHISGMAELTADHTALMGHVMCVAADLARQQTAASNGYRLVINSGPAGGQTVPHLHLHLLAGRQMGWPPG